jgi:raffinose/stachyose/melibiose transport system permease protein
MKRNRGIFFALCAVIIAAVIPIIAFYFSCQKYIIEGITAGSVKG